jgi:uncharacterized protein YkwD
MQDAKLNGKPSKSRPSLAALVVPALALILLACSAVPAAEIATPTLLPYPDGLDFVLVQDSVTDQVSEARAAHGLEPLLWDETLQELAEGRAWGIVKGEIPFDEVDNTVADRLGEPVAELRACLSHNATTPEAVARAAVGEWLADSDEMLLGHWERIGVGFDWGCPQDDARGVVLVVLLADGEARGVSG